MCRWLGYLGGPIEPRELLYDPERSLIEQSRRHAPDMVVPNGDGFHLAIIFGSPLNHRGWESAEK